MNLNSRNSQWTLKALIIRKQEKRVNDSTPIQNALNKQPDRNLQINYVNKHQNEIQINGFSVSTRVKQLFNTKYSEEQDRIAEKAIYMQNELQTDISMFNLEQQAYVFKEENQTSIEDTENLTDQSKNKVKIVLKNYLEQKMESKDQQERNLEIKKLIKNKSIKKQLEAIQNQNKQLNNEVYTNALLKMNMRLGYINKQKVIEHKLQLLSNELLDAKKNFKKRCTNTNLKNKPFDINSEQSKELQSYKSSEAFEKNRTQEFSSKYSRSHSRDEDQSVIQQILSQSHEKPTHDQFGLSKVTDMEKKVLNNYINDAFSVPKYNEQTGIQSVINLYSKPSESLRRISLKKNCLLSVDRLKKSSSRNNLNNKTQDEYKIKYPQMVSQSHLRVSHQQMHLSKSNLELRKDSDRLNQILNRGSDTFIKSRYNSFKQMLV